ncbi:unnamed protein product [Brassica rapa]|uniref:MICOS complex subunit MIC10 n=1 Tax=Brassica campestris TaxID=3711 RepID=A0A3P6BT60_BRACM|nr:unnamed protein product [Brassica rapa]VDD01915.1 unnamed protein product [Brassica rapa]
MGEKKEIVPPEYDVNAKWDACIDLTTRRFLYSSLGGAFAGLLFFRSPVTRWASIAFGAGIGIGSAYTDCSRAFDAPSPAIVADTSSVSQVIYVYLYRGFVVAAFIQQTVLTANVSSSRRVENRMMKREVSEPMRRSAGFSESHK